MSTAHADECDLKSITGVLKKITELPKVDACASASGFSLSPPSSMPGAAQLSKICSETSCVDSVSAIVALDVPSCTLALLNNINIHEIVTQIQTSCKTQAPSGKQSSSDTSPAIARAATGASSGGSSGSTLTSASDNDKSCQ
ncbi:hypothetical protein Gpo141_00002074 [Globisporangium polare]